MTYLIIILFILLAINEYNQFKLYKSILEDLHQAKMASYYSEMMNAYTHKKGKMVDHWVSEMYKINKQYEVIKFHPFKSYIKQEIL